MGTATTPQTDSTVPMSEALGAIHNKCFHVIRGGIELDEDGNRSTRNMNWTKLWQKFDEGNQSREKQVEICE
jgi:hypothetical protein